MVLCGLLCSLVIAHSSFGESSFIAACFSLSSTPLVIKFTSQLEYEGSYMSLLLYYSLVSHGKNPFYSHKQYANVCILQKHRRIGEWQKLEGTGKPCVTFAK